VTDLPPSVSHINGDRRNLSAFVREFRRFAPDVVLDTFPFQEQDAASVMKTFRDLAGRVVAVSSMDVYRAYGRFCRFENGPPEAEPFAEDAPLRTTRYPYRASAKKPTDLEYNYDKIPVEQAVMGDPRLPGKCYAWRRCMAPGIPSITSSSF
jgi:hypothetical protein